MIELTGTRDPSTELWINNVMFFSLGDSDWSVDLTLQPGTSSYEIWLIDAAGNQGESEWVDVSISTTSGVLYDYDAAGRVKSIYIPEE